MKIIEKIFYYLMAVCFMNIIFLVRMIPDYLINSEYTMSLKSWICFGIVALLTFIGILASVLIAIKTLKFKENSLGIEYKIVEFKNYTGEQYFTHFSLLVLTAFAVPYTDLLFDCIFICIIHLLLGFIYIRENLYYINPTLNILKYRIYECKCLSMKGNQEKTLHIFAKNVDMCVDKTIKLKSNRSDIVRIAQKKTTK